MTKRLKILYVAFILLLTINLFSGCQVYKDAAGETHYRLSPFAADKLEQGGEAGVGIAEILAPFFGPAGGIVAGGLATALGIFKKYKPKLTEFQTKSEMSHTTATVLVEAFETLKKDHPKVWEECIKKKINEGLNSANIDPKVLENFIRALRGLPAKA